MDNYTIGQRIDVYKVLRQVYSDTSLFTIGTFRPISKKRFGLVYLLSNTSGYVPMCNGNFGFALECKKVGTMVITKLK